MTRLLFLAHIFPPAGGGGVQRPAKFVKYLSRLGWQVTVVTTQPTLHQELHGLDDPSLLRDLPPDLDLRRIESLERPAEPPRGALAPGRLAFERWFASLAPARIGRSWPEPLRTLRRWWWARHAADPSQGWADEVVRRLAAGGEQWPIILATGSPCSSILAARDLARRWQVPFVADLRDPWCVGNDAPSARLFRHHRLEAAVLRDAARTVVVTSGMRDDYVRAYPEAAGRIEVIENGVDLEEACRREPVSSRDDRFEVVYTGVLTEGLSPETFFQAAGLACRRSRELAEGLRVVIAGRIATTEHLARRRRVAAVQAGLGERLEERGYLPHDEVVRLQRSAAVLLSIVRGGTHIASGKSYEYVAAGRPVLALVDPDGAAMAVLRHAPVVVFPAPDDPEAVAAALLDLFERWRNGEFDALTPRVPEAFTREFQAGQLDRLLRAQLGPEGGKSGSPLDGAPSRSRLPNRVRGLARRSLPAVLRLGRPWARRWALPGYFDAPSPALPRSIALIACHWIGDTLWASQVVPVLRAAWPEAAITVLTKPHLIDLWRDLVPPERIIPVAEIASDRHRERASWMPLIRRARSLRARRFDLVLDLTGNRYSALFAFLLRPAGAIGHSGDELGWLYSARVAVPPEAGHLRERPYRVVRRLLPDAHPEARLRPPTPSATFVEVCHRCDLDPSRSVVVVAPGAGWPEKRWPEATFRAVVAAIAGADQQVAIVGTREERAMCERMAQGAKGSAIAVVTDLTLGEACGLLSGASAVIGHDSGLVHLAAAYGRRTLALYTTATDPAWSRPVGPETAVLRFGEPGSAPERIADWATSAMPLPGSAAP